MKPDDLKPGNLENFLSFSSSSSAATELSNGQKQRLLVTTLYGSNGFESPNDVSMNKGWTTDNGKQSNFPPEDN
ncbi:hypothetical protein L5515_016987 [Caenorhabditis briggsae]|uniref:Uncharacterized protein n=1 Tax=Caenorhabditis briggsae TaxID=6238 RepID=A0AAE8ZP51_CAEBR|nr:hypothetical protein L3Y34_011109 [Caenorhabditis briggsae]UMM40307.1 hypothetical protein L5515_016987 [Caenorhabditis briggsae]